MGERSKKKEEIMSEKENEKVRVKGKKCQKRTDVGRFHNYPQELFGAFIDYIFY